MDFEHLVARVPPVLLIPHAHADALSGRAERKKPWGRRSLFPGIGELPDRKFKYFISAGHSALFLFRIQ